MKTQQAFVFLFLLFFSLSVYSAPISVVDYAGHPITLKGPARRIISLTPHLTEMLFAVGAGEWIKGTVEFSNYPPKAKKITRIGTYETFDLEKILDFNPDLIVAWPSGNPTSQLELMKQLGLTLYYFDPNQMVHIPRDIRVLGTLVGNQSIAETRANSFEETYRRLQERYSQRPKVRVFYQIWDRPLMTINGEHLIDDIIRLCGGDNIFQNLSVLAPTVSVEAVLKENPSAIIASGMAEERPEWLDLWRRWRQLKAVKMDALFVIHPDLIQRHSLRIIQGAEQMCLHLETVRNKQKKQPLVPSD